MTGRPNRLPSLEDIGGAFRILNGSINELSTLSEIAEVRQQMAQLLSQLQEAMAEDNLLEMQPEELMYPAEQHEVLELVDQLTSELQVAIKELSQMAKDMQVAKENPGKFAYLPIYDDEDQDGPDDPDDWNDDRDPEVEPYSDHLEDLYQEDFDLDDGRYYDDDNGRESESYEGSDPYE